MTGWALSIAGVPWLFTSHALGSVSSSSPLWWAGETGVSPAEGWLDPPRGTITERARPLDGDLEVSALSFTLHDAASGGSPLLTTLAARDSINVTSTPLPASITAAATTITVGDGSLFTAPCFAWINREAVRVTAIAGNDLTVTRGVLGTLATAHTADATRALFPEAFTAVPWTTRRKVCLWRVEDGTATLVWTGIAQRAPALGDDGATFTLACDPLWSVLRQAPIGGELARTALVGWSSGNDDPSRALLRTEWSIFGVGRVYARTSGVFRTLGAVLRDHEAEVTALTTAASSRISPTLTTAGDRIVLAAEHTVSTVCYFTVPPLASVTFDSVARGVGRYQIRGEASGATPTRILLWGGGLHGSYCLSSAANLPSSWSTTSVPSEGYGTWTTPGLRLAVNDNWHTIATPDSIATSGALGPRIVDATGQWVPRKPGASPPTFPVVLTSPEPLQVVYTVRTEHWSVGVKDSVVGLCEDGDARDWSFTGLGALIRATAGLRVERTWMFDGRRTLGALLTECCLLHGCSLVTRGGLLALHAWGWPSAGASPTLTIAAADIVGKPTWSRWAEGLANRVVLKGDALQVTATQEHSRARYGPGRSVQIDLADVSEQTLPVDDPLAFAREVVGRLELWSEPLSAVTVRVRGSAWATVELGALVAVSEWMLPDGTGTRGLSSARGFVIARTLDLTSATVVLEVLLFPRTAYPYAPCAKVDSVVASDVVALAIGYVDGVNSYSGVADSTTFEVGDIVDLVERDTTTLWTERLEIGAVDTIANEITFTTSMSATAQTKIGAGWVDLRFAPYADCAGTQQAAWMFVADDTTRVIDGTAATERPIAP